MTKGVTLAGGIGTRLDSINRAPMNGVLLP